MVLYNFIATNMVYFATYIGVLFLAMIIINGVASFLPEDCYDYSFNNGYKSVRHVKEYAKYITRYTRKSNTLMGKVVALARANATLYTPNYLMLRVLALVVGLTLVVEDLSTPAKVYFFVVTFIGIAWNLFIMQESDRRAA